MVKYLFYKKLILVWWCLGKEYIDTVALTE